MQYGKLLFAMQLLLVAMFSFTGCATNVEHYKPIQDCLKKNQFEKASVLIKNARENGDYEKKDRVLYYLDLGMINHYAGNCKESNKNLELAEKYMQELYTKSISKKGMSILTNNNELPYYGEEYENIYINVFKALNYEKMDKAKEALVEIRDMYEKIEYMKQKYEKQFKKCKNNTLTDDYGDKVKKAVEETEEDLEINSQFTDSALGRYLNYAMYISNRDFDDAHIGLSNMRKAIAKHNDIYNFEPPTCVINPQYPKKDKVAVHCIALLGKSPVKVQSEMRIPVTGIGVVKFVMPMLKARGTNIDSVKLFKDDILIAELQKIEDVNRVARSVFNLKKPIIIYKNIFRSVVKEAGGVAGAEAAEEAFGGLGKVGVTLATEVYTELSEQADLRTTRLFPGEFRVASFYLPPGKNALEARFYDDTSVIDFKKVCVEVSPGTFHMIELVHFM